MYNSLRAFRKFAFVWSTIAMISILIMISYVGMSTKEPIIRHGYASVITEITYNENNTMTIGFWDYPFRNRTETRIIIQGHWNEFDYGSCLISIVKGNDGYWYLEQYDKWVDGEQTVIYSTQDRADAFGYENIIFCDINLHNFGARAEEDSN